MSTSEEGQERTKKVSGATASEGKSVRFEISPVLGNDLDKTLQKPEKKERKHKKKKKHHILVDERDKIIEETFEEIGENGLMSSFGDDTLTNSNDGIDDENGVRVSPRHHSKKSSSKKKSNHDEVSPFNGDDDINDEGAETKRASKVEGKIDEEEIEMLKKKLRAKQEKKAKKHKKKSSSSEASFSFISGIEISSSSSTNDASPFPIDDVSDDDNNSDLSDEKESNENGAKKENKDKKKKKKKKKSSEDRYFSKAFMSEFIDEDEINDDDDDDDSDSDDSDDDDDIDDNYCDRVPSDQDDYSPEEGGNAYDEAGICDLPPGWEPRFDYKSKRWYYVDHNTRTTHWRRPSTSKIDLPLDPELYPDPKETATLFIKNGPPKGKKGVLKTKISQQSDLYVNTGTPRHTNLQKVAAKNAKSLALNEDDLILNSSVMQNPQDGTYFTTNATYSKEIGLLYKDVVLSLRSTTQVAFETFEYDPTFGMSLTRDEKELRMFYTVYTRRVARPSFDDDLFIKDYAPEAYDHLRKCLKINRESYMQSWSRVIVPPTDPKTLTDIILLSGDKKFVLRAVDHSAAKLIFKNFYNFMQHFHSNPSSSIAKVIGLYRIPNMYPSLGFLKDLKHMYFIAILNPVAYAYSFDEVYDMKPYKTLTPKNDFVSGDTFKMLVENRPSYVQYDSTKAKLLISEKDRKHLIKQLDKDVNFLADLKFMGYCAIISVHYTDLFTKPPSSGSLSASSASFADSITIDDCDDYLATPSLSTDLTDPVNSPESPTVMTPEIFNIADRSDLFENSSKVKKSKMKVKRASSVTPSDSSRSANKAYLTPMEPVSLDIASARRVSRSTDVLISPRHLINSSKKSVSSGGLLTSSSKNSMPHSRLAEQYFFSESPDGSDSGSNIPSPRHSNRTYKNNESSHERSMSPIEEPPISLSSTTASSSSSSLLSQRDLSHKRLPSPAAVSSGEARPFVPKIPLQGSLVGSSGGSEKYVVKSPRTYKRSQGEPRSPRKVEIAPALPRLNLSTVQLSPRSTRSPDVSVRRDLRSPSLSSSPSGIIRTPRNLKVPPVIPVSKKCKSFTIYIIL